MSLYSAMRAVAAVQPGPPTVDLAFAISGDRLPESYAFPLEAALVEALPWLADNESCGIHAIRAPLTAFGLVLSRRSRLVLRIPAERVDDACRLEGRSLPIADTTLLVGPSSLKPFEPFATLQAWNVVTGASDEQGFLDDVAIQLEMLGVRAKLICGRPEAIDDGMRRVSGFGLVLHELSPAHSLLLQAHGLGYARRLGCGVFVPHKIIEGLGADPD